MQVRHRTGLSALLSARPVRDNGRDERGVAAVEFAIIMPLLVMVVFAIIGFGFAMAQSASLASGARAGARLGAVGGVVSPTLPSNNDCGDVITLARVQARTIGVDYNEGTKTSDVGVTVERLTGNATVVVCSIAPSGVTPTGPTAAVSPCTNGAEGVTAATEARVRVTTTLTGREFIIPVPGIDVLTPDTLEKTAEYRCEYH